MAKSIVKEIIIGLLLCLAIILLLAVLLYGYIPNNKVIPEPVAYKVPDDIKQVLEESSVDTSQVILTYEVNGSDLSTAQRTNEYNPGKVNPFSSYIVQTNEETQNQGTSTNASTTNANSANSANSSNDESAASDNSSSAEGVNGSTNGGGTYFKDNGKK